MRLLIDYPWYFVLFCLLAGVAYSAILYFRSSHFSPLLRWVLSLLRFLAVFIIAFLLLSPLVRMESHQKEKPIIVIAQDNSQSVALKTDAEERDALQSQLQSLAQSLSDDFDVQVMKYGASLSPSDVGDTCSYAETATDMSGALDDIVQQYQHRNLGAVILTGDGIYTQGMNPVSSVQKHAIPIYTVALGDTAVQRDAAIVGIRFNRKAFMGDQFPVEVTVRASRLNGRTKSLSVTHAGRQVFGKQLKYEGDDFSTTETLFLDADKAGLQQYTIAIASDPDEANTRNNSRTITVEVVDGRQKIAIVAAAPHPDVAALRMALEANKNYEVESFLKSQLPSGGLKVQDFDLVIYHNCVEEASAKVSARRTPSVYVVGTQTDLARFNALHLGVEVFTRISKHNEATPVFNPAFSHFALSESSRTSLEQMPPLSSPFGDYRLSADVQTLCYAKIGNIAADQPLVALASHGDSRRAFVMGEGLWRWRLADFQTNGSHDFFDGLVEKIVTFASQQIDKNRFQVIGKTIYSQNEQVVLDAELYDNNYELTNQPDAVFSLVNLSKSKGSGDTATQHPFNRVSSRYSLNLGVLAPGQYRYVASTVFDNDKLTSVGQFMVEDLNIEELNLVADHTLLHTLAQTTGAVMVYPDDVESLYEMIRQRDDLKTVIYTQNRFSEMARLPWIFFLILALLTAEWVLRKYHGTL